MTEAAIPTLDQTRLVDRHAIYAAVLVTAALGDGHHSKRSWVDLAG
jgi:hypothetical protein